MPALTFGSFKYICKDKTDNYNVNALIVPFMVGYLLVHNVSGLNRENICSFYEPRIGGLEEQELHFSVTGYGSSEYALMGFMAYHPCYVPYMWYTIITSTTSTVSIENTIEASLIRASADGSWQNWPPITKNPVPKVYITEGHKTYAINIKFEMEEDYYETWLTDNNYLTAGWPMTCPYKPDEPVTPVDPNISSYISKQGFHGSDIKLVSNDIYRERSGQVIPNNEKMDEEEEKKPWFPELPDPDPDEPSKPPVVPWPPSTDPDHPSTPDDPIFPPDSEDPVIVVEPPDDWPEDQPWPPADKPEDPPVVTPPPLDPPQEWPIDEPWPPAVPPPDWPEDEPYDPEEPQKPVVPWPPIVTPVPTDKDCDMYAAGVYMQAVVPGITEEDVSKFTKVLKGPFITSCIGLHSRIGEFGNVISDTGLYISDYYLGVYFYYYDFIENKPVFIRHKEINKRITKFSVLPINRARYVATFALDEDNYLWVMGDIDNGLCGLGKVDPDNSDSEDAVTSPTEFTRIPGIKFKDFLIFGAENDSPGLMVLALGVNNKVYNWGGSFDGIYKYLVSNDSSDIDTKIYKPTIVNLFKDYNFMQMAGPFYKFGYYTPWIALLTDKRLLYTVGNPFYYKYGENESTWSFRKASIGKRIQTIKSLYQGIYLTDGDNKLCVSAANDVQYNYRNSVVYFQRIAAKIDHSCMNGRVVCIDEDSNCAVGGIYKDGRPLSHYGPKSIFAFGEYSDSVFARMGPDVAYKSSKIKFKEVTGVEIEAVEIEDEYKVVAGLIALTGEVKAPAILIPKTNLYVPSSGPGSFGPYEEDVYVGLPALEIDEDMMLRQGIIDNKEHGPIKSMCYSLTPFEGILHPINIHPHGQSSSKATYKQTRFNYTAYLYADGRCILFVDDQGYSSIVSNNYIIRDVACGYTRIAYVTEDNRLFVNSNLFTTSRFDWEDHYVEPGYMTPGSKRPIHYVTEHLTNIKEVACGRNCMWALTTDGNLMVAGSLDELHSPTLQGALIPGSGITMTNYTPWVLDNYGLPSGSIKHIWGSSGICFLDTGSELFLVGRTSEKFAYVTGIDIVYGYPDYGAKRMPYPDFAKELIKISIYESNYGWYGTSMSSGSILAMFKDKNDKIRICFRGANPTDRWNDYFYRRGSYVRQWSTMSLSSSNKTVVDIINRGPYRVLAS